MMQISTKTFNEQSIAQFNEISAKIQNTQNKIATGKNVIRASEDPVKAIKISAVKDYKAQVERFNTNIDYTKSRLEQSEVAMKEIENSLVRYLELTIQAKNDTYSTDDRNAIQKEMEQIQSQVLNLSNSQDSNGNALFSGFKSNILPFAQNLEGDVYYLGDQGNPTSQISETNFVSNSINGAKAFMRVDTSKGYTDIFSIMNNISSNIETISENDEVIGNIKSALNHVTLNITDIGSTISILNEQHQANENRILVITEDLSKLEDADLAELVAELQSLLLSKEAAQKSYSMIGQQNLFDFIR
ncbi:MAG: flagellar hook-associated protein FlgL [Candidatus Puniceispirillales bacterium]